MEQRYDFDRVIDRHGRLAAGHDEEVISVEMHHAVYNF